MSEVAGCWPPRRMCLDDGLAVDRQREGAADACVVVEAAAAHVEPEKIGVEVGIDAQELRRVAAVGVDLADGQV